VSLITYRGKPVEEGRKPSGSADKGKPLTHRTARTVPLKMTRTELTAMKSICLLALTCAIAGCSGSSLIEITGNVSLDDKPVQKGIISFWPVDGTGPTAQTVITDGKFVVAVAPGAKKVGVEAFEQSGEARPSGPSGPAVPIHKVVSPARYNDPGKTELRCEVNSSAVEHSFSLKSS
jgi:hypothetical protein